MYLRTKRLWFRMRRRRWRWLYNRSRARENSIHIYLSAESEEGTITVDPHATAISLQIAGFTFADGETFEIATRQVH